MASNKSEQTANVSSLKVDRSSTQMAGQLGVRKKWRDAGSIALDVCALTYGPAEVH